MSMLGRIAFQTQDVPMFSHGVNNVSKVSVVVCRCSRPRGHHSHRHRSVPGGLRPTGPHCHHTQEVHCLLGT